jgi:hypothetical protein
VEEVNKYLEKIARLRHLKKVHKSEVREMIEGELSGRAVDAATLKKKHKHHEKKAVALALYQCPVTQMRRWYVNGEEVPAGWVEVKKTYKKFPKKA